MTVIEEIKEKLDLVDIVQEHVTLRRSGASWHGVCPFHSEKTGSFTVFPKTQTWFCFGQCHKGGDVIDFVMLKNGWDFKETLSYLAQRAGVALKPLSAQEQQQVELAREREAILEIALGYFQERLWSEADDTGRVYATEQRGWKPETIKEAGIGYFGKGDWNELRKRFQENQVDLMHPLCVALVGFKGDVAAWARARNVEAAPDWITAGKIPAMPPEMLIYSHRRRGRIVYLAGRRLPREGQNMPKSWNLPEALVGPRQAMFNPAWQRATGREKDQVYAVVEGQGDGVTLAEWEIPAMALAGGQFAPGDTAIQELLKAAAKGRLVLAFDDDEAGLAAEANLAKMLLEAGLKATQFFTATWPAKDANDWLIEGGQAQEARQLLKDAPTWLERRLDGAREDTERQREIFGHLAMLDVYEIERWRGKAMDALDLRVRAFDALLKAARRERGLGDDGQPQYLSDNGQMWNRTYDQMGEEKLNRLAHFEAQIVEDILRDDGQDVRRELRLNGRADGKALPLARVDAKEFSDMGWVMREWGSQAIIEAGRQTRDHLRAAMLLLSKDIKRQTIYTHLGWRELDDGRRCYLSSNGALGAEGEIEVDIDRDLLRYAIPLQPEQPEEAMKLVLKLLDLGPDRVVWPLFGAMFVAPLRPFIELPFMMWVYGMTGSLKSTITALFLNLFGPSFNEKRMPADFLDTVNRLAHKSFLAKDCVLVVDDFAPQSTRRSQIEYQAKAERMAREAGNQAGRGRMMSNGTAQTTYTPRSLVIATGEDLAGVEGILARMFVVEVRRDDVKQNLEKLSALQDRRERLCHAMAGYLIWVAESWEGLKTALPQRKDAYRQRALQSDLHLRYPESLSSLAVGCEMGLRYATQLGALRADEYQVLLESSWYALMENVTNMMDLARREKPQELFVQAVSNLLTQGKIYLRPRKTGEMMKLLGGGEDNAELVGWYDDECLHFNPGLIYTQVYQYYRVQGKIFPQTEQMLKKTLAEVGYSVTNKGRLDRRVAIEDGEKKEPALLSIRRDLITIGDGDSQS